MTLGRALAASWGKRVVGLSRNGGLKKDTSDASSKVRIGGGQ